MEQSRVDKRVLNLCLFEVAIEELPGKKIMLPTFKSRSIAQIVLFVPKVFVALMGVWMASSPVEAQVVIYETPRPAVPVGAIVAQPVQPFVANYTPAGNYAAVTAFSPPVMMGYGSPAVEVKSYYAPAPVYAQPLGVSVPVTSYYAPPVYGSSAYGPSPVTAYYPSAVAPVTAYYAPAYYAPVAVPLYRRGLFGGYRPVRTVYQLPGYGY